MREYIERRVMIKDFSECNERYPKWTTERVATLIYRQPVADAEHVIHCKDCMWYGIDKIRGGFCKKAMKTSMWSPGLPIDELKPDDYCSRGER